MIHKKNLKLEPDATFATCTAPVPVPTDATTTDMDTKTTTPTAKATATDSTTYTAAATNIPPTSDNSVTLTAIATTTAHEITKPIPKGFEELQEGMAKFIYQKGRVFYNNAQVVNRDLSVLAIRQFLDMVKIEDLQQWQLKKDRFLLKTQKNIKNQQAQQNQQDQKDTNRDSTQDLHDTTNNKNKNNNRNNSNNIKGQQIQEDQQNQLDPNLDPKLGFTHNLHYTTTVPPKFETPPPSRPFNILEALSATGLRALRYHLEIPGLHKIYANDIQQPAVETIRTNVLHNNVDPTIVIPNHGDAITVMMQSRVDLIQESLIRQRKLDPNKDRPFPQFNIIDLDPYGSAAPFLDSAIQSIQDGGLLLVTCTDLIVLCGTSHIDTCYARYNSLPIPQLGNSHEAALRIVLATMQLSANRYGRVVEPLVSLFLDFYIRILVRVKNSKIGVINAPSRVATPFICNGCGQTVWQRPCDFKEPKPSASASRGKRKRSRKQRNASGKTPQAAVDIDDDSGEDGDPGDGDDDNLDDIDDKGGDKTIPTNHLVTKKTVLPKGPPPLTTQNCDQCGGRWKMGGQMWTNPLQNQDFISQLLKRLQDPAETKHLKATNRLQAILTVAKEEVSDVPLFLEHDAICRLFSCETPPAFLVRYILRSHGYQESTSHTSPQAIKTDAPTAFLFDIYRHWIKDHPVPASRLNNQDSPVVHLLSKEPTLLSRDDYEKARENYKNDERKIKANRQCRFPPNPEPNWGPKTRASGQIANNEKHSQKKKK